MSSTYVPVRLATLVISAVLLALSILDLVRDLQNNTYHDKAFLATMGITILVLFLGAWGSYKHDRSYLITFAFILAISIIVGCFANTIHYSPLGVSILLVILALTQAELIKRGFH